MWGFLPPSVAKNLSAYNNILIKIVAKIIIYGALKTTPMQTPLAFNPNQCANALHCCILNVFFHTFKNPLLTANADPPCIQPKRMQTPLAFKPNQCRPPLHCTNFMPPKPSRILTLCPTYF